MPTVGFHPTMAPSSVEKRNAAAGPPGRMKSVGLPLAIVPVGVPVGKVLLFGSALGMVTIREFFTPAPLKSVLRPVPLSEIHQGLEELRESPQGLTSVGSVTGATPEVLATRLTCVYCAWAQAAERSRASEVVAVACIRAFISILPFWWTPLGGGASSQ